ncbi:hypothetical protein [Ferruginibacter sp.]
MQAQTGTLPVKTTVNVAPTSVIRNVPTQTIKLNPIPPANPLPDIIITNISFTPNTANTYYVNYTLKNTGTSAVKKGLLSLQTYINGGASGGGSATSLGTEINQLLNPGESFSSKNTFSTTGIVVGQNYAFQLCVNGMKANAGMPTETWVGQQFTESNYTNNTMQSTFTIPPPPPAPADILVTITSIDKSPTDTAFVRINYTLKNIGATAIPQTASLSIQSSVEDTDNNPATFLGTGCCGQPTGGNTLNTGDIPFAPGAVTTLYYDARVAGGYYPSLPKMVLYKFNVVISNNGSFTESNSANNKGSLTYLLK